MMICLTGLLVLVGVAGSIQAVANNVLVKSNPPVGTKVGQMYPDFYLPKLDGGFGRLSDYRGKKVLLFHFASW